MRSSTSPQIFSGELRKRSSVLLTVPSVEFSIGTTPKSALPASTSWNTSSIEASGSARTEWPKCVCTAVCVNVPSGPRNATFSGSCCARHADMISRNRRSTSSLRSGPLLRCLRHAQHLRLALRAVEIDRAAVERLGDADELRELGALVEQAVDLLVDGIDALAHLIEVDRCAGALHPCARPHLGSASDLRGAADFLRAMMTLRPIRRAAPRARRRCCGCGRRAPPAPRRPHR